LSGAYRHPELGKNAMKLSSFATVALILIPSLAYAAGGGGGTGENNAGNGAPGGANADVSNGNTPPGPANGYYGNSASDRAGSMSPSKEMKRQNEKPQKVP
jgi:hypothetical protein